MSLMLGIDVGGTKTDGVVLDARGEMLHRLVRPSGKGEAAVVNTIHAIATDLAALSGTTIDGFASVGIGVPGSVFDGVVSHAQNLDVARLDVAGAMQQRWGFAPVIDNDVNAAAVGAWVHAGAGTSSSAFLNLGTGLAAGIVIDGKLWRGARGAAGEIGMISMDPAGPLGPDGMRGGLETCASGAGIAWQAGGRSAAEVLAAPPSDESAEQIRERMFMAVATAVRILVLTLDVEQVLLGGGLTRMGAPLLDGVRKVVRSWERENDFMRSIDLTARIHMLDPEVPIAAIGAAMRGAGRG